MIKKLKKVVDGLRKEKAMIKLLKVLAGGLALIVSLAGCNFPNRVNTVDGNQALTIAAQTIQAQLTLDAIGLPPVETGVPTVNGPTQAPTITIAPTNTEIAPSATPEPCDVAGFVRDVTIEDGTSMMPGTSFTKTWRVINEGQCTWTKDYDLVFYSGESMDGAASVPITNGNVSPGTQLDVSVNLVAPDAPGTYRGTWQLRNGNGIIFTLDGFWIEIKVLEPAVYSSKLNFKVTQNFMADLDNGDSPPIDIEDFLFKVVSNDNKRLKPMNSAAFVIMGKDEPSYGKCNEADRKTDEIVVNKDLVGYWLCYETNQGRLGTFKIVSLTPTDIAENQVLELNYITWNKP
jgi:hypothetical protein